MPTCDSTDPVDMDFSRAYRDALGLFATGVAVATTISPDGTWVGNTISSFNSVSLAPPLVLFSIARNNRSFPIWELAHSFAISILAQAQADLSARFARPRGDKWEGLDPKLSGPAAAPVLRGAIAWFECHSWARYDGGDHLIVVGEVIRCSRIPAEGSRPLLFFRSRYAQLAAQDSFRFEADWGLEHGW